MAPRLPVDGKKVIEHRITLGQKERDVLETVSTGYTVNKIATPIIALLSDVTALAALYVFLLAIFPNWSKALPEGWEADTVGMTPEQVINWAGLQVTGSSDITTGGGPIGAIIGALLGGWFFRSPGGVAAGAGAGAVVGEEAEQVVEFYEEQLSTEAGRQSLISVVMLSFRSLLINQGVI